MDKEMIKDIKWAAKVFRALNHPLRQAMLQLIADEEKLNVTEIYTQLRIDQTVASAHLSILFAIDAVKKERDGKCINYSLNQVRLIIVREALDILLR